ncbi:MAG: hypothetical protein HY293_17330 [Planctomycetes bacterium]|nr:hypothetical protein [Planctomycetota bacterium]
MRLFSWIAILIAAGLGAFIFVASNGCFECVTFQSHRHHSSERPASTCLKMISSAQAEFRANDRDGSRTANFWRADIAGLYALAPGGGPAIKLIPLDLALADGRPARDLSALGKPKPKSGYWFKAIRHADETTIDAVTQFAACAYPADPAKDKYTFVVDENNTVYRTALPHPQGIEVFPTEEEMKQSWSKLD